MDWAAYACSGKEVRLSIGEPSFFLMRAPGPQESFAAFGEMFGGKFGFREATFESRSDRGEWSKHPAKYDAQTGGLSFEDQAAPARSREAFWDASFQPQSAKDQAKCVAQFREFMARYGGRLTVSPGPHEQADGVAPRDVSGRIASLGQGQPESAQAPSLWQRMLGHGRRSASEGGSFQRTPHWSGRHLSGAPPAPESNGQPGGSGLWTSLKSFAGKVISTSASGLHYVQEGVAQALSRASDLLGQPIHITSASKNGGGPTAVHQGHQEGLTVDVGVGSAAEAAKMAWAMIQTGSVQRILYSHVDAAVKAARSMYGEKAAQAVASKLQHYENHGGHLDVKYNR